MTETWFESLRELSRRQWRPGPPELASVQLEGLDRSRIAGWLGNLSRGIQDGTEHGGLSEQFATLVRTAFGAESVHWWFVPNLKGSERGIAICYSDPTRSPIPQLAKLARTTAAANKPIWVENEPIGSASSSSGDSAVVPSESSLSLDNLKPLGQPTIWFVFATSIQPEKRMSSPDRSPNPVSFNGIPPLGSVVAEIQMPVDRSQPPKIDCARYLRAASQLGFAFQGNSFRESSPGVLADQSILTKVLDAHGSSAGDLLANIQKHREALKTTIERSLATIAGCKQSSLSDNVELAKQIQNLLDQNGFRVLCPECGSPAILRCLRTGNSPSGSFVFDHQLQSGRTFHGGKTALPELKLIDKPIANHRTKTTLPSKRLPTKQSSSPGEPSSEAAHQKVITTP